MKLCSACLLGIKCRYDGKVKTNEKVVALSQKEILIPICPEQLGGQSTPRPDAQIKGGTGADVLDKKTQVIEPDGNDITDNFTDGAEEVLKIAKLLNIKEAIMKQESPACGCGRIFDGTFSETSIQWDGVTTALLKRNGIQVISEEDL